MIRLDEEKLLETLVRSRYRVILLITFGVIYYRIQENNLFVTHIINAVKNINLETPLPAYVNPYINYLFSEWNIINLVILLISAALSIYTLYRNQIKYMLIGVIIVYTFYIVTLWSIYSTEIIQNNLLINGINNLSRDIALTTLALLIIEYFRPLLTYRRISRRVNWKPSFTLLDIVIYISILSASAMIIIYFTQYLVNTFTTIATHGTPELGELINIYVSSHVGRIIINLIALGIITYFLYNLVEPTIIYLTGSKGQAMDILKNDYKKLLLKEEGYIKNIYKYVFIGGTALTLILVPIIILLFRTPNLTWKVLADTLENLIRFRWEVSPTNIDLILSKINILGLIDSLKERIEAFIRFIMYLLF